MYQVAYIDLTIDADLEYTLYYLWSLLLPIIYIFD